MKVCSIFIGLFFSVASFAQNLIKLSSLNIDPKEVSISGVSSGAFMAQQMATAFSKSFLGFGSVAGGIYWCSQGNSQIAQSDCMNTTAKIQPKVQIQKAQELAAAGLIDDLANLRNQRAYIFASPKDSVIKPPSSDKLVEFLSAFMDPKAIKFENTMETAHGFLTLDYGAACNLGFLPWLLKCNYDQAGEILKSFHSLSKPRQTVTAKNLFAFDQTEFGNLQTPLFKNGWIYIPDSCQKGEKCSLHMALHGCQMNPDFIQSQFAEHSGFNEWAEDNHLVIIYPQSAKMGTANPYGCWDWFGFTGADFVTQKGPQMAALKTMIDRLLGAP